MTGAPRSPSSQLVTVFGGSGFLGRHVVRALAKRGYRIRVAVRRPDLALFLHTQGTTGQITAMQANLRYPGSVRRALINADAAVNLVGILREGGRQSFDSVQAEGAGLIAQSLAEGARMVHVSALGADPDSGSAYARSKAEGEARVLAARPEAVVFRPSVLFGPGDDFFNRFGALARALPVLPLAGAGTRFQPVFVGDVAEAIARAVEGSIAGGQIHECGGPEVRTLRELVEFTVGSTGRRRLVLPLPPGVARFQALGLELLDTLTFGLLPDEIMLTRDQLKLLEHDNVVSDQAKAEGRTLEGIGIAPTGIEAVVPAYLTRFRSKGQFSTGRDVESERPDDLAPTSTGAASGFHPERASGPSVGERAAG